MIAHNMMGGLATVMISKFYLKTHFFSFTYICPQLSHPIPNMCVCIFAYVCVHLDKAWFDFILSKWFSQKLSWLKISAGKYPTWIILKMTGV